MKRMSVILLAATLTIPLSQVRAEDKDAAKDKKAADVKKVDRELTEAHIKRDAREVDRLTADDYIHTSPNGRVFTKKQILTGLGDGRLIFDKIDDSEVKVAIYGDTAVMNGLSKMKGKSKSRGDFDEEYRWTRVYVLHDGKWRCVAEQMNRYVPPEKDK
jgi:ketosteroid isomerase-like protein